MKYLDQFLLSGGIALVGLAISTFFGFALLVVGRNKTSTRLLAFFVFILSLSFLLRLALATQSASIIVLPFVVFPAGFLIGPLVYYHTWFVLNPGSNARVSRFIWIAPALSLLVHSWLHFTFDEFRDPARVLIQTDLLKYYTLCLFASVSCYSLLFVVIAIRHLRFSSQSKSSREVNWLRTFLFCNGTLFALLLIISLILFFVRVDLPVTPIELFVALALLYAALYHALRYPEIFSQRPGHLQTKYAKQTLDADSRKEYLRKIQSYMTSARPYLDEGITLASLSNDLQLPPHHVSMVINIELGMNFFRFINMYRVKEAERLIAGSASGQETLLNLAFQAGFNSKGVFNRVFKQETGLTPAEFRKKSKNSSHLAS